MGGGICEYNMGLRQKCCENVLFSTAISDNPAGYPLIYRISGRITDIRHELLAGYPVSGLKSIGPNPKQYIYLYFFVYDLDSVASIDYVII